MAIDREAIKFPVEARAIEESEPISIRTLLDKHKSIKAIPDEDLARLGYVKDGEGRIVKEDILTKEKETAVEREQEELSRREKISQQKKEREAEKKVRFEKKNEQKPFGVLKIELEQKEALFKRVVSEELEELYNCIQRISLDRGPGILNSAEMALYPKNSGVLRFLSSLEKSLFAGDKGNKQFFMFMVGFLLEPLIKRIDDFAHIDFDEYLDEYNGEVHDSWLTGISPEKAEIFYNNLERKRSSLTDQERIREDFDRLFNSDWKSFWRECEKEFKDEKNCSGELKVLLADKNIVTFQDLILKAWSDFFKKEEFAELADDIKQCETIEDLKVILGKADHRQFPSFDKKEDIKVRIKKAEIKEKERLSAEYKDASEKYKTENQLVIGAINFLSSGNFFADFFKKTIKDIEKILVRERTEEEIKRGVENKRLFYLDGTPDPLLDEDPGKISGDCTEGRPLPFDDTDVPVYNIKFFDEGKNHIGNIYLLETKLSGNKVKKVWHLEAIQLPVKINWQDGISNIVAVIAKEAEKKGVDYITVNEEPLHISNYDYIREAVMDFQKTSSLGRTMIEIPLSEPEKYEEIGYSSFQGDGNVFILWEKK